MPATLSSLGVPASLSIDVGDIPIEIRAGLLLRASIKDGTSNTMTFTTSTGPVRAVVVDAARIGTDPNLLKNGFGLLLPAATGLPFHTGSMLKTCSLLPYVEQDHLRDSVITLEWVRVAGVERIGADVAMWLQPAGIIAVLIG